MKTIPALFATLLILSACGRNEATVPDSQLPMMRSQIAAQPSAAEKPANQPATPDEKPEAKPIDPDGTPPAPKNPAVSEDDFIISVALARANEIRLENKLPELRLDEKLVVAAQKHAEDMKARNYFDHVNPEKENPYDRMKKAGATFHMAAENIAFGVPGVKEVFDGWINSPVHKTNLMNKAYGRQGIGFVGGYWVHLFAN